MENNDNILTYNVTYHTRLLFNKSIFDEQTLNKLTSLIKEGEYTRSMFEYLVEFRDRDFKFNDKLFIV